MLGPGGGVASTHRVSILEIIVDEARVVEELAGCSPGYGRLDGEADRRTGAERELGAETLTAGGEVLANNGAEAIEAGTRGETPDEALYRFERRGGWRRTVTRFGRRRGASWFWRGGLRHAIGP
jgi:hypothetical protein